MKTIHIWLIAAITFFSSCTDDTTIVNTTDLPQDNFPLGQLVPVALSEHIIEQIRNKEVSYILIQFDQLDHLNLLKEPELFPNRYYVGQNVILARVDETFHVNDYQHIRALGLIDPSVKYNQNVREYIIPKLIQGESSMVVLVEFYSGINTEEMIRVLEENEISFKLPLNYSQSNAVAKITSVEDIDNLLHNNIIKEIFYHKLFDEYYDHLEAGTYPWLYKCGGHLTKYGPVLKYEIESQYFYQKTNPVGLGWHSSFHNNPIDECVFLTYHIDSGNSNGKDVHGNSFPNSGDAEWSAALASKTYWDPQYSADLHSAFLEWQQASGGGFRITHASAANGYGQKPIANGIHITFEEKNEYPQGAFWSQVGNVPAITIRPDAGPTSQVFHNGSGQIYLNGDIQWSRIPNYANQNIPHFGAVILHEIGHALGLEHENSVNSNGDPISIMFDPGMPANGIIDPNKGVTSIYQDDIDGMNQLYPSSNCCTNCPSGFNYTGNNCYSGLHIDPNRFENPLAYSGHFWCDASYEQFGIFSWNYTYVCPSGFTKEGVDNCKSIISYNESTHNGFFYYGDNSFNVSASCN